MDQLKISPSFWYRDTYVWDLFWNLLSLQISLTFVVQLVVSALRTHMLSGQLKLQEDLCSKC